ncbi:MAG: Gfo/Idh/MocA family oxidoreductase, partial [Muribaculaceae bacterium]|nr:Gfo/Idh/MocA family oxidoreductase [Muribaculaceae bacterium]
MNEERPVRISSECGNKKFAIAGVAGYVAPRHIKAVKATGNVLVAAHDISDSVGILDSYFPEAYFTTDSESFRNQLKKCQVDFLSVCTPNHLHCPFSLMGLEAGADVICEKPVALSSAEVRTMSESAQACGRNIW